LALATLRFLLRPDADGSLNALPRLLCHFGGGRKISISPSYASDFTLFLILACIIGANK